VLDGARSAPETRGPSREAGAPAAIEAGRFRRDLFFRLHGLSIVIPPLRERPGEIVPLAVAFLDRIAPHLGLPTPALGPRALGWLLAHDWPGNVRELRNVVEFAVSLSQGRTIEAEHLLLPAPSPAPTPLAAPLSNDFRALERRRIVEALEACGGNQTEAARCRARGGPRRPAVRRPARAARPLGAGRGAGSSRGRTRRPGSAWGRRSRSARAGRK